MVNKILQLKIGLFAPSFEEQLKDFNIPKEQTTSWEEISNFIIRQSIREKITQKQKEKLFQSLFEEIKNYIKGKENVQ